MIAVAEGSAAQHVRAHLPPHVRVAGAFKTIPAHLLDDLERPLDCDEFVCGDSETARAQTSALVELLPGLRAVDVGVLSRAASVEHVTALAIAINRRHKIHDARFRVVGLPSSGAYQLNGYWLQRAAESDSRAATSARPGRRFEETGRKVLTLGGIDGKHSAITRRSLRQKKAFANLATVNADGSPQVTPVWWDSDGTNILVNTAKGRVKAKNLERNPRSRCRLPIPTTRIATSASRDAWSRSPSRAPTTTSTR